MYVGNKQVNRYQHSKSKSLQKILNEPELKTDITSKVASGDLPEIQSLASQQSSPDLRKSQELSKVYEQSAKVWPADDTNVVSETIMGAVIAADTRWHLRDFWKGI